VVKGVNIEKSMEVDTAVFVCTTHNLLAELPQELREKIHADEACLVEKPGALRGAG